MKTLCTLQQWIDKIQSHHPAEIELGLERISVVFKNLKLPSSTAKIVLIGGTNGKGTTLAILEALAVTNKKTVFSYSSPHIFKFNERIRINGVVVEDKYLIRAFEKVELARQQIKLTFFEFTTLAAMIIASQAKLELEIYEVGLGGRLDAVNILQPDISIITSIGIDHTDWLGNSLEQIAAEKMAIARANRPLILGDDELSDELLKIASSFTQDCRQLAKEFHIHQSAQTVELSFGLEQFKIELATAVHPKNFAGAVYCASLLGFKLSNSNIQQALSNIFLPGRFQLVKQHPQLLLDVSHNLQAITCLSQRLKALNHPLRLVCGMLSDKLEGDVLKPLMGYQYQWFVADLDDPRSATANQISKRLNGENVMQFKNLQLALKSALDDANGCGSIVVFGSFLTVAAVGLLIEKEMAAGESTL